MKICIALMLTFALAVPTLAEDDGADLAKKLQNPVADLISVPIQLHYNRHVGPDDDGSIWQVNLQPVYPFKLNEDWLLISRTIIPLISLDDIPADGMDESGMGDILQSFFFSPSELTERGWVWGVGPVLSLPTATNEALGTEKWGAGPSVVALKQEGPWTVGILANHVWSFAGDDDRADVSATYVEPWVTYTTKGSTSITASVEMIYDWEADEASVPVTLLVDQLFQIGGQYVSIGVGAHYWADSPEWGPEGFGFRLQMTFLFPK
jgi:hypothetical protein